MDEEGDIADGPNGPIIFQGGRWVPYGGTPTPSGARALTPARQREPAPQTQAQAQKDQIEVTTAGMQPDNIRFNQASKLRDDYNQNPEVKAYSAAVPVYASALQSAPDPSGDQLLIYSFAKMMDPASAVREGEYATVAGSDTWAGRTIAQLSNQLSRSGTLSPEIRQSLRAQMRNRLNQLNATVSQTRERYRATAERAGLNPADVIGDYPGAMFEAAERDYWKGQGYQIAGDVQSPVQGESQQGAPREVANKSARWTLPEGAHVAGTGPPSIETGAVREFSTPVDKEYGAAVRAAFGRGAQLPEMNRIAHNFGFPPWPEETYKKMAAQRARGEGVAIGDPKSGREQRSGMQQAMSKFLKSPVGGTAIGAANGATAGFFDEGVAAVQTAFGNDSYNTNLQNANQMKQLVRAENPNAFALGEIGGSLAPGLGVTGALRGAGVNVGAKAFSPVAMGVDAAMGGLYGAGENNDNRGRGAMLGAAVGTAGGTVGRGAMNQGARMVAPTGGDMAPLFAEGVRPTPGQRFGESGWLGRAANTGEEALQSIPLLGSIVKGARQGARDQFETGAFNQALRDIGRELPSDASFGTKAHAFVQDAFDKAYRKARRNMNFVRDVDFDNDLNAILQDARAGGLTGESLKRLQNTIAAQIDRRAPAGVMDGEAYKAAQTVFGKRVAAARNSVGSDPELTNALERVSQAMDQAARRNSPSKAVKALDAADSGYAKLVRIEDASQRAGGGAGRFSPTQFDRAVQSTSGGRAARSKAYNRGDALMEEYATAGRNLVDKLPNSGTADRAAMTGLLAGGSYISPGAALTTVGATLPYALHKLTGGLMAPRTGAMAPALNRAADFMRSSAPLGGDIMRQLTIMKNDENRGRR